MNYYNENDPKACAWLAELIKEKLIPEGKIDARSITDVQPDGLEGFTQCHFFAGIGGWALALQLANWPQDRPVWTASCPCQPFSGIGKRLGTDDERHLWTYVRNLIGHRRPSTVFGEQVASLDGLEWLSGVRANMERAAYAFGAADLCAAGINSPHIRQRSYWVAHSTGQQRGIRGRLAGGISPASDSYLTVSGGTVGLGHAFEQRLERLPRNGNHSNQPGRVNPKTPGPATSTSSVGYWDRFDTVHCRDGKNRRIEPGSFPLVAGLPKGMGHSGYPGLPFNPQACAEGRVMRLRGYGNAIVPQVASKFIEAYMNL